MKRLGFILQKEFIQIFRDKTILAMIFVLPVLQLGILPLAMDFEVKSINLIVVNKDFSPLSYKLINKINSSGYFKTIAAPGSYKEAIVYLDKGQGDIILEIPPHLERNLIREGSEKLFIGADAINGTKSGMGTAYLNTVIGDFNRELLSEYPSANGLQPISVTSSIWYNPFAKYPLYIVPGILVFLLTIVAGFLTSLNIVREKEVGTIEQINVTPIKKWQFIVGKMIPFWVLSIVVFTVGLLVTRFGYGIPVRGNLLLLYGVATIYIIAMLGFGLFISTISDTQVQSMFIAFFFVMIFVLMSGLFTSVESMPGWARNISDMLPISHFMRVMRLMIIKGSGFWEIKQEILYLCYFAVALNGLAIWNYRKTSA